jgi:hypothetical protein
VEHARIDQARVTALPPQGATWLGVAA